MKKIMLLCSALVLTVIRVVDVEAEEITIFDSNTVISAGHVYDTVVIKGDGTVVDMTGGDVNNVITMNSSTFKIYDCNITKPGKVRTHDSSKLVLSGGNVDDIELYGNSFAYVTDDANLLRLTASDNATVKISSEDVTIRGLLIGGGENKLEMLAGMIEGLFVMANKAHLEIRGCDISFIQIEEYSAGNQNRLNISGGTVDSLILIDGGNGTSKSIISLSGGTIGKFGLYSNQFVVSADLWIIGHDLDVVPYGGASGEGQITGYWNNGEYFNIDLEKASTYDHVKLYDGVIPPDCVERPESDLSGDCVVDFKDFSTMASDWLDCGFSDPNDCWR